MDLSLVIFTIISQIITIGLLSLLIGLLICKSSNSVIETSILPLFSRSKKQASVVDVEDPLDVIDLGD